jgi:hypothetical protein
LLPKVAGHLTIVEYRQGANVLTGDTQTKNVGKTWRREECSLDRPCFFEDRNACVADNERITNVVYECDGTACGWSTSSRRREYNAAVAAERERCIAMEAGRLRVTVEEYKAGFQHPRIGALLQRAMDECAGRRAENVVYLPDYDLHTDNKCAAVFRRYDADAPLTITYKLEYKTLSRGTEEHTIPNIDLTYGETITVALDPGNERCHFEATGLITATNQRVQINQQSGIGAKPVRLVSNNMVGDRCRAVFQIVQ